MMDKEDNTVYNIGNYYITVTRIEGPYDNVNLYTVSKDEERIAATFNYSEAISFIKALEGPEYKLRQNDLGKCKVLKKDLSNHYNDHYSLVRDNDGEEVIFDDYETATHWIELEGKRHVWREVDYHYSPRQKDVQQRII